MGRDKKRSTARVPPNVGATLLFQFDQQYLGSGSFLVGIDEAGRGPWAGPVVAGAACLSPDFYNPILADSKQLSPLQRDRLYDDITQTSAFGIGIIEVETIDRHNILRATYRAMRLALENLLQKHPKILPQLVLIDGREAPPLAPFPQKSIVRGDGKSAAIAAAGILAKVTRDRIMRDWDAIYPQYGFSRHKGYGTELHLRQLSEHGPCPIHRKSFAPVQKILKEKRSIAHE